MRAHNVRPYGSVWRADVDIGPYELGMAGGWQQDIRPFR